PFKEETQFIQLAASFELYPKRCLHVKGNENAEIKRSLLEFTFIKDSCVVDELIIEKERHVYTTDYVNLTKEFYLKM
ncbi:MAG: tRNA (adenine-N(6)-)-methyltransferase, partial [Maribacter sp.]